MGSWNRGWRRLQFRGLLRKINHLPAAAARGQMSQNPRALLLRKRLFRKSVEALRFGMKIELG
jgi:hypothetical protein